MGKRIVSLLASATEIVAMLGMRDRLVAISHECDYPPDVLDRPRVSRPRFDPEGMSSAEVDRAVRRAMADHGSVYTIDGDALARLRPELILTQAVCEVCAVPTPGVREVVADRGLDAEVLSLDAHSLEDILDSVVTVGRAADAESWACECVQGLERRLEHVDARVAGAPQPRVLALEWLDPPFAPGHWVPQQIERAGGTSLVGTPGERSHELAWEELSGLDPDVLVLMPCGYGLDAARRDTDLHAERIVALAPRAIRDGRAFVVDGSSYFNRSGPRVVTGVEILAGLIHPDRNAPPPSGAAAAWRPTPTDR